MSKLTIMIVDDEPDLAGVLADQFELAGHLAFCCSSVADAVNRLSEVTVDFVLSDIRMPRECGVTLLDRTRVPIIFMSGFSDFGVKELLEKGAIGMVTKPFAFQELMDIILSHRKTA